jgi:hypothetical protein
MHMIKRFSSLPSRLYTRNIMDSPMFLQVLFKQLCAILMRFLEWECLRMKLVLNKYVLFLLLVCKTL